MDFNLFQPIYDALMVPLQSGVAALREGYVEWVQGWVKYALILVIGWRGALVLHGRLDSGTYRGDVFRAMVVYVVCSAVGEYDQWVRAPLQSLPDELGAVAANGFGNGIVGTGGGPFDALFKDAMLQGLKVWQVLGWTEIGPMLVVLLFWVFAFLSCAAGFLLRFGTEIILLILLAIGVIPLGLMAFEKTRGMFFRWLDAVAQRIALMVLVVIFINLLLAVEAELLERFAGTGSSGVEQIVGLLLGTGMFGVGLWIIKELPRVASDLAGGSGGSAITAGSTNATYGAAGTAGAAGFAGAKAGASWAAAKMRK